MPKYKILFTFHYFTPIDGSSIIGKQIYDFNF